jgi:hypothetical protein
MHFISVQIARFIDSAFPGWVECEFVDAEGHQHIFKDKVPIFTVELLNADSKYPTPGDVACEILERFKDEKGRELKRVSTEKPFYIESSEGLSEFAVLASQVTSAPD